MFDDVVAELGAFDFGSAFHEAGEVVGDSLGGDGAVETFDDEVGGFAPAHVAEHHFAGEDDGTGVHFVEIGIFGGGAVGGLEDGVASDVVDVATGGDADTADLGGEGVREVIAVQVEGGDDVEVFGTGENLLQGDVGDGVFDDEARTGFAFGDFAPRAAVEFFSAKGVFGDFVTPVTESALGVLHDVALVDQSYRFLLFADGVFDGRVHEALGTQFRDGFDADTDFDDLLARIGGHTGFGELGSFFCGAEADFVEVSGHVLFQERDHGIGFVAARLEVDTRVDVFGVLAEDGHVHLFGVLDRRGRPREVAHGTQTNIEVEHLAQSHVERADTAADGRGERAFDADEIFVEASYGFIGKPVAGLIESGLARENFEPLDFFLAAVGFLNRRVHNTHRGRPDVGAGAVAAHERDGGVVWNLQYAVLNGNFRHDFGLTLSRMGRGEFDKSPGLTRLMWGERRKSERYRLERSSVGR